MVYDRCLSDGKAFPFINSAYNIHGEEFLCDGGEDIKPKYLGDDIVLLMGLSDEKAEKICREEDDSRLSMFHSQEKWSPHLRTGFRLVRVLCWRIPLHAWDLENINKIVAGVEEEVDFDDDLEDLKRLDKARVLLKTPWHPTINHNVLVSISGVNNVVHIVENACYSLNKCRSNRGT